MWQVSATVRKGVSAALYASLRKPYETARRKAEAQSPGYPFAHALSTQHTADQCARTYCARIAGAF